MDRSTIDLNSRPPGRSVAGSARSSTLPANHRPTRFESLLPHPARPCHLASPPTGAAGIEPASANPLKHFWTYARMMLRYRLTMAVALGCAMLSAGGLGAGILGIKPILDQVLGNPDARKGLPELAADLNATIAKQAPWLPRVPRAWIDGLPDGPFTAVFWIVVGLGVLTVIGATFNFLHAYLSLTVISRTIAEIRTLAFDRVIHLPMGTVLKVGPSDLISRIVYDSAALSVGLNALISRALAQASKGVVALFVALWFDWRLTLAALVAGPIVYTIIRKLGKRINRASRSALEGQASLYHAANEVLSGLRVVKVHTAEDRESARFDALSREVVRQEFKVRTARALSSPLVETVTLVVLGSLSLVAVKAILTNDLDATTFFIVLGSLGVAGASLKPLSGLANDMSQADAAAGRLSELLSHQVERGQSPGLPTIERHRRSIEFENVSASYAGAGKPAIDGVSLSIPFGQTYAFVGPNGSGKTTLLSLIPRLLECESGRVLIDGADVAGVSVRSLRSQMAVVTQETVLFKGTIRDNIAYGANLPADAAQADRVIRDAARRARAEDFILAKPGGYDHALGEGGSGLSGGQRQRLAIARAILRDPAVLILDEATSMIDAESEARIAEAISEFVAESHAKAEHADGSSGRGGRTCLIVAHRLSTVLAADQIVVMDQGRIVDRGTHANLLKRCDLYRTLAREQLMGGDAAGS